MRRRWPEFSVTMTGPARCTWFGSLVGIMRPYRVAIEYGPPTMDTRLLLLDRIPLVRVLQPRLEFRFNDREDGPLPHVFFDAEKLQDSPLCLFDPAQHEWSAADLIADTTVPWAVDWLACYEGWLATGRWYGGGRHPLPPERHGNDLRPPSPL